jgi:hypothetical protein
MITELNEKQEARMQTLAKEWIDRIYSGNTEIDEGALRKGIDFVYELCGMKPPEIIIVDSPKAAQDTANRLCGTENVFYEFGSYVNVSDFGWVAFYEFFKEQFGITTDEFDKFLPLIKSGLYDTIQFEDACIVSRMPSKTSVNDSGRLHCEDGPAIVFADGYGQFHWNGIAVPKRWVLDRDSITAEEFAKTANAEMRRCIIEILGGERVVNLLGLELVDEDVDAYGNPMRLYSTKEPDPVAGEKITYLSVTCNSTGRQYYLCVRDCDNVWAAKAQTFGDEGIQVRHGDVGLVNLEKFFDRPIIES